MAAVLAGPTSRHDVESETSAFYRKVLETLNAERVPFLVGGAFAFACHTGIQRNTKDLDLFIRQCDYALAEKALSGVGYTIELTFPHWLAKVHAGDNFVDLIFNSGNGISLVDDIWFEHAIDADVMGVPVRITPVEETVWSKAFIMERERYDGADVVHLLHACARHIDWQRLLGRFGVHWRVLLSHLVLFGFVYPGERSSVPACVMSDLLHRLQEENSQAPAQSQLCAGTLLSREQYLHDTLQEGYLDGRVRLGSMTSKDVADWTDAIPSRSS